MVGLQLGTQAPLFALSVGGDNVYAASGSTALLQVRAGGALLGRAGRGCVAPARASQPADD